jgi:ElaA protein
MTLSCRPFESLSANELYTILAVRAEVFVVEQNCVYQDLDFKDQKALHCQGFHEGKLAAYTRIFDMDKSFEGFLSIGRVIVAPDFRKYGYGKQIMQYSIQQCYHHFGYHPIKIGAQAYLERFYSELGFKSLGIDYLEDGIPHKIMVKE